MKKAGLHLLVFFGLLLMLLFHFSASSRLLSFQDEKEVNAIDVAYARSTPELNYDVEPLESDGCDIKDDEECSERRMIAEAHLDYIYTQHHNPANKHQP